MQTFIIIILLLVGFILFNDMKKEHQTGALIQLHAKGPQDTYLTGDAWRHLYYYPFYSPYYYPYYIGKYPYYRHRFRYPYRYRW